MPLIQAKSTQLRISQLLRGHASYVVAVGILLGAIPRAMADDAAPSTRPATEAPMPVKDPALAKLPILAGWPVALPGEVMSTPTVADIEGNGKPCIVVTCRKRDPNFNLVNPNGNFAPQVFALRADGTAVPGWPVELAGPQPATKGLVRGAAKPVSFWSSVPTPFRVEGHDHIALVAAGQLCLIDPDGRLVTLGRANIAATAAVADLTGKDSSNIVVGNFVIDPHGTQVAGWDDYRAHIGGLGCCVGDACGDGKLKTYRFVFGTQQESYIDHVLAFDQEGKLLPGWTEDLPPYRYSFFPPVMGDIGGDEKKELVGCYAKALVAWTWDGKAYGTSVRAAQQDEPGLDSVLADPVDAAFASPTLADLDGDGKAEIIVYDNTATAIRAWHGNGTPLFNENGIIATTPNQCYGVSVVGPDADGTIHLFAGTYWVKIAKDQTISVMNMLPDSALTNVCQPTAADVNGDGKLDVIFGTADGRVVVYETGIPLKDLPMQWPTAHGNFRHAGVWENPAPAKKR